MFGQINKYIQLLLLDQVTLGYFKNYETYSFEVETFYKKKTASIISTRPIWLAKPSNKYYSMGAPEVIA